MTTPTVFTQLSEVDLSALLMQVLVSFHEQQQATTPTDTLPEIGGMEMAMAITGLKRPTIYGLTSARSLPCFRVGKRLYFKRSELIQWIEAGRKWSGAEMALQAAQLPTKTGKTKPRK
jgi:excisionase family DNA binding protein